MLPKVEDIKNSLRIDHNEDNSMLENLIITADDYIFSAISASEEHYEAISEYKQYSWAVSLLVQHWYLNRQEATSHHMPNTVLSLVQQMRGKHYANH